MRFERPTRADYENFLVRLYFGPEKDYLGLCIERAYLDFGRTIHGIGKIGDGGIRHQAAVNMMRDFFAVLASSKAKPDQQQFDQWHRDACDKLKKLYAEHNYREFYFGQAQKWLNMTLKYIFVMGHDRLPDYEGLYELGHVPLDNIIIEGFKKHNPPPLSGSWSRLDDYEEYLGYQQWIRITFPDSSPLAVEFHLWLDGN